MHDDVNRDRERDRAPVVSGARSSSRRLHATLRSHRRQHAARAPRRFGDALRRRDERDAEEAFATRAEAGAGHHDDAFVLEQPLGEQRARHLAREAGSTDTSSRAATSQAKPAARNASTAASRRALKVATLAGTKSSWLSSAATPAACTAMNCPVSVNDFTFVSTDGDLGRRDGPAAAPARHVVRLGERVKLDRDVARAVDLEDARRHVAVERELGVRVVVDEQNVELAAPRDDALEIVARRDRRPSDCSDSSGRECACAAASSRGISSRSTRKFVRGRSA